MKINAAVVYKPNDPYVIEEVELAEPKAREVLVKVAASGVCHTDHLVAHHLLMPGAPPIHPVVLGHEGSGTVVRTGAGVTGFKAGDRVSMSFAWCGTCPACLSGFPYACEEMGRLNFGGRAYDGTTRLSKDGMEISNFFNQASFATYAVTHENNLVLLPDEMDLVLAAPLGCGIQTGAGAVLNALKPEPGSSLVVYGCGAVGMSALLSAVVSGCSVVIGVDTVDSRLDLAMELGATHVVNAKKTDAVAAVREITGGRGANYSVDATGSKKCTNQAMNSLGLFGACAVIGGGDGLTEPMGMELGFQRQLTVITEGNCIPRLFIPKLVRFYLEGRFPFDKLIRTYDFADINRAADDSASGYTIKPVLVM